MDQSSLLKAEIPLSADDHVVEDPEAQDLGRLDKLLLRLQVRLTRLEIP
jgi:hypothetical protein